MTASLLFNPSQASTEELESTFVGRHSLVERLERDFVHDQSQRTPRHWQLLGPRGSGKSHLTEVLSRRMRSRHGWRIARLPEENYQAFSLGELLEQIVVRSDPSAEGSPFSSTTDDGELQDRAVDLLRRRREDTGRPLMVVLENLAAVFERQLRSVRDQARFRDILTNNPPFVLVATSTSQSDATVKHSAPFYDFFHTLYLDDLSQADITELVKARADWDHNAALLSNFDRVKGRIEAIYHLSGGNPRLALALYRVVDSGVTTELHQQIMKLLDEVTPYYQSRLNDIPPQAARVLTEMAISDTVVSPAEIARRSRMQTNQVTAHINRLMDERLVVQGGRPDARSRLYELKDRLLRIWLQMRESVGVAKRLRFLAEFFERWYAGRSEELQEFSRRTVSDFWTGLSEGDEGRCDDRLKTLSYLADMRPGFDRSPVMSAMSAHVRGATESEIRAHIDGLQRRFERSGDLREREALAYLLAECFTALDAEEEGRPALRSSLNDGTRSEAIALRYASALTAGGAYVEAFNFATEWIAENPEHLSLLGPAGIAACGIRKYEDGFRWLRRYIERGLCEHCTEKALRQTAAILQEQRPAESIKISFWNEFLARGTRDVDASKVQAVLDVLVGKSLAKIPTRSFLDAAAAWKELSAAPAWFLSKGICGLAHRRETWRHALPFLDALAERSTRPLSQFAIDHLVEILPDLRHQRTLNEQSAHDYARAMSLVRERTSPASLAKAFRVVAPYVAKRFPETAPSVLQIYCEWLRDGLLAEPITPYSEAVEVLSSSEPDKIMQSLHPETRDAVSLLLRSSRQPASEESAEKHIAVADVAAHATVPSPKTFSSRTS
jgi:DNA-binding MarR family transcriptional regulator